MVDYNLQVPGIAPAQNAMQINPMQMIPLMQQQQLNNMLMQERARDLAQSNELAAALRSGRVKLNTPEGLQEGLAIGGVKSAPLFSAAATVHREARQAEETALKIAALAQKMGIEKFDAITGRFATVNPADPSTYVPVYNAAKDVMHGVKIMKPEEWARLTPEQRLAERDRILTDAATIRAMVLKNAEERNKPVSGNWVTNAAGELEFQPSTVKTGQVPTIIPGMRAPVGAPMGAQPPLPPQRGGAAGYVVPGVGQLSLNALSPPSAAAPVIQNSISAQAVSPQIPRSATGEKFINRAETGFAPAQGMTPEQEAAAKAKGQKTGELAATEPERQRASREAAAKARTGITGQLATLNEALGTIKEVENLSKSAKSSLTGFTGRFTPVSAEAREAYTKFENLKGVATSVGRSLATVEGKLGNMAVQEWKIVADQIAALDPTTMEPADLDRQLKIMTRKIDGLLTRLKEGYTLEHERAIQQDPRLSLSTPSKTTGETETGGITVSPETQRLLDKYK